MTEDIYKVEIRYNLVTLIVPVPRSQARCSSWTDDPLEISSILAQNNKSNGCFDGDYFVSTFGAAQKFASLCLSFQQTLCEKSLISVQEAGTDGNLSWVNPFIPLLPTST